VISINKSILVVDQSLFSFIKLLAFKFRGRNLTLSSSSKLMTWTFSIVRTVKFVRTLFLFVILMCLCVSDDDCDDDLDDHMFLCYVKARKMIIIMGFPSFYNY